MFVSSPTAAAFGTFYIQATTDAIEKCKSKFSVQTIRATSAVEDQFVCKRNLWLQCKFQLNFGGCGTVEKGH